MSNDRTAHMDLLRQVAESEDEERNVRRILGAKLTDADLDAHAKWKAAPWPIAPANHAHRHSRPACSRCESWLEQCVTPEACERAESNSTERAAVGIVLLVVAALMTAAIVSAALILERAL